MKRILIITVLLLMFWNRDFAHADTCAVSLMPAFTANQSKTLCKTFGSAVNQSLIPSANNTYDLGSASLAWRNEYVGTSVLFTSATNGLVAPSTSDAADSSGVVLAGGGANASSRGSGVKVWGNESATGDGALEIYGGDDAGSSIFLDINNASAVVRVRNTSDSALWTFANSGTLIGAGTSDIGWTRVNGANVACNTTCVTPCVFGWDTAAAGVLLACTDATADSCLCAGGS